MFFKNGIFVNNPRIKNVSNPTVKTVLDNDWKPVEDIKPEYDPNEFYLEVDYVEELKTKVKRYWTTKKIDTDF